MSDVKLFWNPDGFELDSIGRKRLSGLPADGDTPYVRIPIRMLSIDTPETNYPGVGKPSKSDARLAELARWLQQGKTPVDSDLAQHLLPRLATGKAGTLQEQHGKAAKAEFQRLLNKGLTRPNGSKRNVFLYAADEHFDSYGRLLAYMAPYYTATELAAMSRCDRATFNLQMVESGWAAPFPIFPSLPRQEDLVMLQQSAKAAFQGGKGAWADRLMLTGYEWRMCVKLHGVAKKIVSGQKLKSGERYGWISRYCVDMTTREIHRPQQYSKVQPYNRIFVWPRDVRRAVAELNLVPGD